MHKAIYRIRKCLLRKRLQNAQNISRFLRGRAIIKEHVFTLVRGASAGLLTECTLNYLLCQMCIVHSVRASGQGSRYIAHMEGERKFLGLPLLLFLFPSSVISNLVTIHPFLLIIQCFSVREILASLVCPRGTFGNVWNHFWVSQQGEEYYQHLVGRGWGC